MGGDGVLDRSSHSAKLATRKAGSGSLGSRSHSRAVAPAAYAGSGRVLDFMAGKLLLGRFFSLKDIAVYWLAIGVTAELDYLA